MKVTNVQLEGRSKGRWADAKVGVTYGPLVDGVDFESGKAGNVKSGASAWAKNQSPQLMARTKTVTSEDSIQDNAGNKLVPGLYIWFEVRPVVETAKQEETDGVEKSKSVKV